MALNCHENQSLFEEEVFNNDDQVNDLHNYYMTQFNLELENGKRTEESDFSNFNNWNNEAPNNGNYELQIINEVIEDTNINEENIKEVLFDLDNIEFDTTDSSTKTESTVKMDFDCFEPNCDYIDDESLIDELCREDNEPYRLTPDIFNDSYLSSITNDKSLLPPIETAFSKHCNYTSNDNNTFQNESEVSSPSAVPITSIENYSYPNNVIYNINNNRNYILPDTPTSCSEFTFDRSQRKVSVSESVESEVYSSSYCEENSEGLDDDELFINLDDLGFNFDKNEEVEEVKNNYKERKDKDKSQGERICLWEHCYERYPNQSTLVEHIERTHVNSYKGDEFSCLWSECARARRPFNARYKLLIHMRVHSGHKPNKCHHPGCGKAFSRLENLKIHVRSHTGERPYACPAPHCRKAFSNSSDRAKHQRTHFNARPYACGAVGCGKRYTDPSSLRKHVKSHPHITNVPRTCIPPPRTFRRSQESEQTVPSSPAKLTTLRCIRDKLAVSRYQSL